MGAALDNAAVLDDQDGISGANGGEAMGDDQRGATRERLADRLLHRRFGDRVKMSGSLIEDHNARLRE
ncbi:hypothetical protein D3C83_202590 [compost metagenome]